MRLVEAVAEARGQSGPSAQHVRHHRAAVDGGDGAALGRHADLVRIEAEADDGAQTGTCAAQDACVDGLVGGDSAQFVQTCCGFMVPNGSP